MRKIKSIQIKAAFLLIAFSLNTIIGFACAIGMNMGFNSHHHQEETISEAPLHHSATNHHHHDKSVKDHHQSNDPDNCCHDGVTKIAQVDKAVPEMFSISVNFLSLSPITSAFHYLNSFESFRASEIKYIARSHHPPIPDIRIAIRSFQI